MQSSESQYFTKLDHLRFIAALMVLVWHVMRHAMQVPSSYVPSWWPISFFAEGHTGVALFMTLSGFIFMTLCRGRQINYVQFLRNRVLRIAPLFLVWTVLYFYLSDISPVNLLIAVAALLNNKTVPGVGWTVIVEFQFYLLFPFLMLFVQKFGLRYLFGLAGFALALRAGAWLTHGTVQDLAYSTIFGRIDQFLLGMIAAELLKSKPLWFKSPMTLLIAVIIWSYLFHWFDALGGYFDNEGYPSPSAIWIFLPVFEGLFYGLIIAAYMGTIDLLPKKVDKSLAWLGMLSYSLYLNHPWVIDIVMKGARVLGIDMTNFWTALSVSLIAVLPMVVVISMATYYLIEKPFLLLRTRYLF